MKVAVLLLCVLCFATYSPAQPAWQSDLDSKIRFYQTTDFGVLLVGTEKSLYALDGQTGTRVWRSSTGKISETAVTPIPDTDLILLTRDLGSRSRLEAVDLVTGERVWQSEKVKGDVMQLAVDPERDLVAVVLVKDPRARARDTLKRKPVVHVLRLSSGDELWKRDLDDSIEMMSTQFGETDDEVDHTLDNYRAPLLLDGRLFLFYDGSTSYDALTGKEKEREKFRINENGLALTEADPIFDEARIYVSGKGRIRAVDRRTGDIAWRSDDLGNCAELRLVGRTLFARTGGQFTRLKDGEIESKGPYGVSAIDTVNGKTLWRYKGADKGLTNFVFADAGTILIADKDDLISIDARTGKRLTKREHKIDKAQFVLINERGAAVVGGRNEIAAFDFRDPNVAEFWRVRHTAPGRGVFRTVAGVALRAAALYFRYGALVTTGVGFAGAANSLRWSGLRSRFGSFDLTTLASNQARNYVTRRIYAYGSMTRLSSLPGLQVQRPGVNLLGRAAPSRADVQESVFDRLDPARQMERLSGYLLRRTRLAELRVNHMYFYTDLAKPFDKKGLVGVNIHTGRDARYALVAEPDPRFTTDESAGLLYSAEGSRMRAFDVMNR